LLAQEPEKPEAIVLLVAGAFKGGITCLVSSRGFAATPQQLWHPPSQPGHPQI